LKDNKYNYYKDKCDVIQIVSESRLRIL